jgi:hypothetical protein
MMIIIIRKVIRSPLSAPHGTWEQDEKYIHLGDCTRTYIECWPRHNNHGSGDLAKKLMDYILLVFHCLMLIVP